MTAPPPLYDQVRRAARRRPPPPLEPARYGLAALSGALLGALSAVAINLERMLPHLDQQPTAWRGSGWDLLYMTASFALFFPAGVAIKRGVTRLYRRARYGPNTLGVMASDEYSSHE